MLQEAQPDGKVFDAIDSFFPEGEAPAAGLGQAVSDGGGEGCGGPGVPSPPASPQTPQELAMVAEAQESFRELVLALLADRGRRAAYLQVPASAPQCLPVAPQCLPVPSQ
ncbi:hypothetical protein QYF61_010075 [Mycteria americana]|uniref:Uncharacterized protein n=1 Tax=Mycteria americana TaxID=33587 RepID=A0AAN7N6J5_MYCAM|nr:hypothetical protein QYF61_010075 [Mycteria americana]